MAKNKQQSPKLRNTKQRQLVLETVLKHKDHPTADEIFLEVREIDPNIGRGTVYRNLNILSDNEEIQQIKLPSAAGADRFDWRLDRHLHIRCTECGKIEDVSIPYSEELDKRLAEETGYDIKGHNSVFEGVCPDCLAKKTKNSK